MELSDDVYMLLSKLSEKTGQLPEILASQWIISETRKQADDPLEKFIGKFKFNKSDWADNHDSYIGEKLSKKMKWHKHHNHMESAWGQRYAWQFRYAAPILPQTGTQPEVGS